MKMRKFAAVLLAIVLLCAAPISELAGVDCTVLFAPKAEAVGKTYKVGDIVEFGSYPQSKVTNSSLVSALNKVSKSWVSYGYYSGTGCYATDYGTGYATMVQGDWMKYADFTYNGTKYRAVTFSQYRPYSTCNPSSTSKTYQDDNGYTPNNIYYFKYEPLKWRVLDPSTGFVLCESIIDAQAYSNTVYGYGTDPYGHLADWNDAAHTCYANDYATSSIRAWLNDDFYNIAFSSSQKANILTSKLDNKAYKTSYSEFDGETTYDKVFLLSWNEVQNTVSLQIFHQTLPARRSTLIMQNVRGYGLAHRINAYFNICGLPVTILSLYAMSIAMATSTALTGATGMLAILTVEFVPLSKFQICHPRFLNPAAPARPPATRTRIRQPGPQAATMLSPPRLRVRPSGRPLRK